MANPIAHLDPVGYLREIVLETHKTAVPEVTALLNKWQDNWQHKVRFRTMVREWGTRITTYVYPDGENLKYWRWTSRGTSPHTIPPGAKGFLAFPWDGVRGNFNPHPKTLPKGRSYGSGAVDWVYTKKPVDHPGTEPRLFEEQTVEQYKGRYAYHVRIAVNRVRKRRMAEWAAKTKMSGSP